MIEVFDENIPIYIQIMDLIKKQMISKELLPGEKLPSVRDMSKQLEVNPNTVQRAYIEMEREMLVYTFAVTAGDMGDRIDFQGAEPIYSGSLILSGRTPLGPVGVTLSFNSTDEWQVVFGLGRPIEERTVTDPAW